MGESVNIMPSPWIQMDPAKQNYDQIQKKLQAYGQQAQQLSAGSALSNLSYQKALNEQPVQTDLSPLMALADSWSGSKLAQSYTKPGDNKDLLMKLRSELDKNNTGMSEQQVQLLKAQLETQGRKEDREEQRDATRAQRETAAAIRDQGRNDKLTEQRRKALADAQDKWVKDPLAKEATDKYYQVSGVRNAIDEAATNPALKGIVPALIARLNEKGVLTDQDIARYSGNSAFAAKWKQYLQAADEGTITDENLALFRKVAENFADTAENTMRERAALHARQYANQTGDSPQQALSAITGGTFDPAILSPKAAKSTAPAVDSPYKPGDVIPGEGGVKYQYNGGNWKDQRNYTKVQ